MSATSKKGMPMSMHEAVRRLLDNTDDDDFSRVPGLFRLWELQHVLRVGVTFRLEEAGDTSDGTPLFALFERETTIRDTPEMEH